MFENSTRLITECVGTFLLILLILQMTKENNILNPLIIGLGLTVIIYLFWGGDYNPVVSIISYINGNLEKLE